MLVDWHLPRTTRCRACRRCGKTCRPAPALFYAGTACVGVASSLLAISMSRFVKRKQEQYQVRPEGNVHCRGGPSAQVGRAVQRGERWRG